MPTKTVNRKQKSIQLFSADSLQLGLVTFPQAVGKNSETEKLKTS